MLPYKFFGLINNIEHQNPIFDINFHIFFPTYINIFMEDIDIDIDIIDVDTYMWAAYNLICPGAPTIINEE